MGRRMYLPAWLIVRNLTRKHGYNAAWIWDVLDDYFNMRKGEGCVMTHDEAEELEQMLEYLNADRPAVAYN